MKALRVKVEYPSPSPPLWERSLVLVFAVVVSSKKQITHVERKDSEAVPLGPIYYHRTA
jgi:hypothetical protein